MILTDYYRFERIATKAKSRMDCTASTHSYPDFEEKRCTKATRGTDKRDAVNVGDLIVYYNDVPLHYGGDVHRKAGKSLSIKSKNLSSIYVPDPSQNLGFGDCNNTSDALLFVFHDLEVINGVIQPHGVIEVFVARGKSNDDKPLFDMFADGELDEEVCILRGQATPDNVQA